MQLVIEVDNNGKNVGAAGISDVHMVNDRGEFVCA